ncbi:MAG: dTDP-4-dehydrorhamnose reductase [Marinilabiliaceae bacterium]|nr:dTDP-4-dehydrorhamnose reductase [Marinilabiliaceae bacterium]
MHNILIIGSDGQLGHEIEKLSKNIAQFNFYFTTINDLDITNNNQVKTELQKRDYSIVVNCAAYTDVNKAESDTNIAYKVNAEALKIIGETTKKLNTRVIHVSTDYVFDGKSYLPYVETDNVNPQSAYGKTKLEGEKLLFKTNPNSIVIRTSWLYSSFGNNFLKTMLKLGNEKDTLNIVFDQIGTPTFAGDLAVCILQIIKKSIESTDKFIPGIYHYSNEGVCSWYDFTQTIFNISNITNCKVYPIESKDYPTPAPRPHYSVLNKAKIKSTFNIEIPHWEKSLKKCLLELLPYK